MRPIFEFLEYREFLCDYYTRRRKRDKYFSYRFLGGKLGIDPGYLCKVLQCKEHLADRCVPRLVHVLKLDSEEANYLRALMQFNKARSRSHIRQTFKKVLHLRSLKLHTVEQYQYEYYNRWYYSAVRALIGLYDFSGDDFAGLAGRLDPPIAEEEARAAVSLLEKIDLIRRDTDGVYHVTDTMLSTGRQWRGKAVRTFQHETIDLATRSLDSHDPRRRDISTVTFTVAEKDFDELRERIREFRSSLLSMADESRDADTVYQLNVRLFPISRKADGKP